LFCFLPLSYHPFLHCRSIERQTPQTCPKRGEDPRAGTPIPFGFSFFPLSASETVYPHTIKTIVIAGFYCPDTQAKRALGAKPETRLQAEYR
jgi:hypothetical protein